MNIKYIDGFFDGEGTVSIYKRKIRLVIPQTNKEILDEIKLYFGVGGVVPVTKRKAHWKDAWIYYSGSNKASMVVLKKLKGHLVLKKEIANKAFEILKSYYVQESLRKNKIKKAIRLAHNGVSYREIERIIGIGRQTVCRHVKMVRGGA